MALLIFVSLAAIVALVITYYFRQNHPLAQFASAEDEVIIGNDEMARIMDGLREKKQIETNEISREDLNKLFQEFRRSPIGRGRAIGQRKRDDGTFETVEYERVEREGESPRLEPVREKRIPQPRALQWSPIAGLVMQVVLSLVVIGAGLYMILSGRYDSSNQHWAYGTVGTVIGFWLKGAK